jgi:hypothetical protein
MTRRVVAAALSVALLAALAAACGRYGSPHRIQRSAAPAEAVPVTDPGVTQ